MERPSLYLVEKTDVLRRALDFFTATKSGGRMTADMKRLAFLANIDFWDWEIENLIFSFSSFQMRAKAFGTSSNLEGAIRRQGLVVRAHIVRKVRWSDFSDQYRVKRKEQVVAPHEILNEIIDKWNALLDLLDKSYYDPQAKNAVKLGADIHPDLSKFKKQRVSLEDNLEIAGNS